jgi:hydroxypyruvate reductase
MKMMHNDAQTIIRTAINLNMPEANVRTALKKHKFSEDGDIYVVAVGKAAWVMANAAYCELGLRLSKGIVITKYGHSKGEIPKMEICEAGHPLPDENSLTATSKALDMVANLKERDEIIFLLSGGGSALFEKPLEPLTLADLSELEDKMIKSGADIVEINTVRKRLSAVKGGRFAAACAPSKIFAVILSDVLGDRIDAIASGPVSPDPNTAADALAILRKYNIEISPEIKQCIEMETSSRVDNVTASIIGSVRLLCEGTANVASSLGYTPVILSSEISCHAKDAGSMMASIARQVGQNKYSLKKPAAIIFGGETVVEVKGNGKGGRNQEIALAAAAGIEGMEDVAIFSISSDGTDGPTEAAGAIVDGFSAKRLRDKKILISEVLKNNDSYNALKKINALIVTGPTGTNINDISVILIG